jgi:hypothetical protein
VIVPHDDNMRVGELGLTSLNGSSRLLFTLTDFLDRYKILSGATASIKARGMTVRMPSSKRRVKSNPPRHSPA